MFKIYSVSDLARRFNCSPRDLSLLLYDRCVPDAMAPVVGGRRIITEEAVPLIEQALLDRQQRRDLRAEAEVAAV